MSFESVLENNPLRAAVRAKMEVEPLLRAAEAAGAAAKGRALHIACGNGNSTLLLEKAFRLAQIEAIDANAEGIEAAKARHGGGAIDFRVGEVRALDFPDGSFDAAFDLGELHNYPDWRRGVAELARVLRPGGWLFLEEISKETFAHGAGILFKALTEHPYAEMLAFAELRGELSAAGFELLAFEEQVPLGLLKRCLAVARRA
jgi:ubiquinone/menaquinone biosynthesis C-methylase UbiE